MKSLPEELFNELTKSAQITNKLILSAKSGVVQNSRDIEKLLDLKKSLEILINKERVMYSQSLTIMNNDMLIDLTGAISDFGVQALKSDGEDIFLDFLSEKKQQIDTLEDAINNLDLIYTNFLFIKRYMDLAISNLDNVHKQFSGLTC